MKNTGTAPLIPQESRYFRNTWMIDAESSINFPDSSCLRRFDQNEALKLSDTIQKRNVFARISNENDFYIQSINELANHTIIEVFRSGDPQTIRESAEKIANLIEQLVIISSILTVRKDEFLKKLGISIKPRNEKDIIIGNPLQNISSKSKNVSFPKGIRITDSFQNRFKRCGFLDLFNYCQRSNDLVKRVNSSIYWLFESRREPSLSASIVKTSIALEALLIFNESENLTRSLSDRVSYLLSPIPETRQKLSKIVTDFYNIRSAVIHGNRKKTSSINTSIIEVLDRICVLMYVTISLNSELWTSEQEFRKYFEKLHWGYSMPNIKYPFSSVYMSNILKFGELD